MNLKIAWNILQKCELEPGETKIVVPEGVKKLQFRCFDGCRQVTELQLPGSLEEIDRSVFDLPKLTRLYLPRKVRKLEWSSFTGLRSLEQITVDAENPYFSSEDGVLYSADRKRLIHCPEQKEVVVVASETEEILDYAFSNGKVRELILPEGLRRIGNHAFSGCRHLRQVVMADAVTEVGSHAFSGCVSLKKIRLSTSIKQLPYNVLELCDSLEEVTIPEGTTQINSSSFFGCSSLQRITLPASLRWIDGGVFIGCDQLREISVAEGNPWLRAEGQMILSADRSRMVLCVGTMQDLVIPAGVKEIGSGACYSAKIQGNVRFPQSLERIGESAFCRQLQQSCLVLPRGLRFLGAFAFGNNEALESVFLPASLEEMDGNPFESCKNLQEIHIASTHPIWCSMDGVLYSKDKKQLVLCPAGRKTLDVPDGVEVFGYLSMLGVELEELTLPGSFDRQRENYGLRYRLRVNCVRVREE